MLDVFVVSLLRFSLFSFPIFFFSFSDSLRLPGGSVCIDRVDGSCGETPVVKKSRAGGSACVGMKEDETGA